MALVTLFTDASFSHKHNRGTWAARAKHKGATMRRSGIIKATLPNSDVAELSAIANGLVCVKQTWAEAGSKIIIQTDSRNAINAINGGKYGFAAMEPILAFIKNFVLDMGWTLDLRHVKGHKGTATRRNAVNTFCDAECRRQMALLLSQLQPKLTLVVDNEEAA